MKTTQEEHPIRMNVRNAKNQLSKLLKVASQGEDVIITSDGKPKAKLTAVNPLQKRFHVNWKLLRVPPLLKKEKLSEELIRKDRDLRG